MLNTVPVRITAAVRIRTTAEDTTQLRMVVTMRGQQTHTTRTVITRIRRPPTATDSINRTNAESNRSRIFSRTHELLEIC
jgi:hypothetical protein